MTTAPHATTPGEAEFADIQGLARFGHGQLAASAFLLLTIRDQAAARAWLAAAPVTPAVAVAPKPESALQVAFSAPGLAALGLAEDVIAQFSPEFLAGMASDSNRSRRLGDTGANDPANWRWGRQPPHLLLMLYTSPQHLDPLLAATLDEQFLAAFAVERQLLSRHNRTREPFGFEDGISQPQVDWQRALAVDGRGRDAFDNRIALGEVLLGYPNEYGLYTARPLVAGNDGWLPGAEDQPGYMDLGRNGSYLVFRQLGQNVGGFWRFLDRGAGGDPQRREQLAAAMVGRRRDGTPLATPSAAAIPGIDPGAGNNQFTFDGDPGGLSCPLGAHVRRANPRTGDYPAGVTGAVTRLLRTLGFCRRHHGDDLVAATRFHRLLRRGRIYGPELPLDEALVEASADTVERGLHFICLGANISRQFEFVQNAWIASPKFAGLTAESDPLLGSREPLVNGDATGGFSLPRAGAPATRVDDLPRFVTVEGGGYFFMPGLRALKYMVS